MLLWHEPYRVCWEFARLRFSYRINNTLTVMSLCVVWKSMLHLDQACHFAKKPGFHAYKKPVSSTYHTYTNCYIFYKGIACHIVIYHSTAHIWKWGCLIKRFMWFTYFARLFLHALYMKNVQDKKSVLLGKPCPIHWQQSTRVKTRYKRE